MEDSMAFTPKSGKKNSLAQHESLKRPILEEANPDDSQLTGNFDNSNDSAHYMQDGDDKTPTQQTHYTQMNDMNLSNRNSIIRDNRKSNRRSGKMAVPPED